MRLFATTRPQPCAHRRAAHRPARRGPAKPSAPVVGAKRLQIYGDRRRCDVVEPARVALMRSPAHVPAYEPDLYATQAIVDPHPHYARLRRLGPVVWLPKQRVYALPSRAAGRGGRATSTRGRCHGSGDGAAAVGGARSRRLAAGSPPAPAAVGRSHIRCAWPAESLCPQVGAGQSADAALLQGRGAPPVGDPRQHGS